MPDSPPPVTIRTATSNDASALSALNADVQATHAEALPWLFKAPNADTFPPDAAAAIVARAGAIVLLALVDTRPVGYAYAEVRRRGETGLTKGYESVYLHHISVRPALRGRGIGSALLAALRSAAAEQGVARLELDVWTFNEPARRFFVRHGFAAYNERMWTL
jgi:ribosomal protein S18 acetylase RimI-like enzyme